MNNIQDLSSMSYTNKDFNDIYSELLTYASKLSHKWDPTSSDESDPGVVLLKLAALIGDKNNYNIDKNILELMPVSVTQLPNARQIFDQCGYNMKYYRSAEGCLTINLKKALQDSSTSTDDNKSYYIPPFTMFSDADNEIVYSSIDTGDSCQLISNQISEITINVIQGIPTKYSVDDSDVITLQHLDPYNRIYLNDTDVAENGIFITNVGQDNYDVWKRVEVLDIEAPLEPCYKFGVSLDGSSCFIEFPEDINQLIGEGLQITYIRTKGRYGNVSENKIRNLYVDTDIVQGSDLTAGQEPAVRKLTNDDVRIRNTTILTGGYDPETIDEAYRAYKRVKDTFNTLVSLKDYTDYMISSKNASNGYVCDRTNDIQRVYKILQEDQYNTSFKSIIETEEVEMTAVNGQEFNVESEKLNAYDLCVYALTYIDNDVLTVSDYDRSFTLILSDEFEKHLQESDVKCVSHDFKKFENNKILMIKNKYPIRAQIISKYKLSSDQYDEVLRNIHTSLFIATNSKNINFSDGADYDNIYHAILNADERIKAVSLEYPTYETYAVYTTDNGQTFKELRIDQESFGGYIPVDVTEVVSASDKSSYYYYDSLQVKMQSASSLSPINTSISYYRYDENIHGLWNDFRSEIFAKNVLYGTTPLYTQDTEFKYGLNQKDPFVRSVDKIVTCAEITAVSVDTVDTMNVKEHENVLFTSPNLIQESNYSSYVKFLYKINNVANKNCDYTLGTDEFIIFFWKQNSDDDFYTYLKYDGGDTSKAKHFSPSFRLSNKIGSVYSNIESRNNVTIQKFDELPSGRTDTLDSGSYINDYVTELNSGRNAETYSTVLTGNATIITKKPNTININNTTNGTRYVCWITKEKNSYGNYVLSFDKLVEGDTNDKRFVYTLDEEEYFIYTNDTKTSLNVLGQGTRLQLNNFESSDGNTISWSCSPVSYIDLAVYGPDAVSTWFEIEKSDQKVLSATEMLQYLVGLGSKIEIKKAQQDNNKTYNNVSRTLVNAEISFTYNNETTNLPVRSADIPWEVRTLLNVHTNFDLPQEFLTKTENNETHAHKVELYYGGTKVDSSNTNISLLTDRELKLTGTTTKGTNVTSVKGVNLYTPLKVLIYEEMLSNNTVSYDKGEFTTTIPYTTGNVNKTISVYLMPGTYLLRAEGDDLTSLSVSAPSDSRISITSFTTATATNNLFKLNVTGTASDPVNITFTTNSTSSGNLLVYPLYRYTTSILDFIRVKNMHTTSSENTTFEQNVVEKLNTLDPDSIFDYTRSYDESKIENPLVANSFLYKNHFYNSFTISQWDVQSDKTMINLLTNVM